jgi:hypothetical protein
VTDSDIQEVIKNQNATIFNILLTGDCVNIHAYYPNPYTAMSRMENPEMLKMALALGMFLVS